MELFRAAAGMTTLTISVPGLVLLTMLQGMEKPSSAEEAESSISLSPGAPEPGTGTNAYAFPFQLHTTINGSTNARNPDIDLFKTFPR